MPGESRRVTITADPRLLANWDVAGHRWQRDAGRYEVFVGADAADATLKGEAVLAGASLAP